MIYTGLTAGAKMAWSHAINLLYPNRCVSCGCRLDPQDSRGLCVSCLGSARPNPYPWCRRCGRPVPIVSSLCPGCRKRHFAFDAAYSALLYEGAVKTSLRAFKYKARPSLSRTLAPFLIAFVERHREAFDMIDSVTAVPLSRSKLCERGYNQSALLAHPLAKHLGLPLEEPLMRSGRAVSQSALAREERLVNVRSVFRVPRPDRVAGKSFLLVDDVCTTGSTLDASSRALKDAGAGKVVALTLARGT